MKRFFLTFLFSLMLYFSGYSQGISVELSVDWRRMEYQFNIPPIQADSTVLVPFMKVVYRNLTEEDIYFPTFRYNFSEFYRSYQTYPPVILSGLMNTQMDMADRAEKAHLLYKDEFYKVEICDGSWEVFLKPQIDTSKEYESDIINNAFWEIHVVLETQDELNELKINKQLSCFEHPDKETVSYREAQSLISEKRELETNILQMYSLSEDDVGAQYSDRFTFLKGGEIYEHEYSLVGFYILGGSYEFIISDNLFLGYIQGMYMQKIFLPTLVNGHQLYVGDFLTNSVEIKF